MAKVETAFTENTVVVQVEHVSLQLTFEEAAALYEYIADSGTDLNNAGPLDKLFQALTDYAHDSKKIRAFGQYPAREYGWEIPEGKRASFRKVDPS